MEHNYIIDEMHYGNGEFDFIKYGIFKNGCEYICRVKIVDLCGLYHQN